MEGFLIHITTKTTSIHGDGLGIMNVSLCVYAASRVTFYMCDHFHFQVNFHLI